MTLAFQTNMYTYIVWEKPETPYVQKLLTSGWAISGVSARTTSDHVDYVTVLTRVVIAQHDDARGFTLTRLTEI